MAAINGIRGPGGAVLPGAGAPLGGAPLRAPAGGHGSAQHAALAARPPVGAGEGMMSLRVGLAKLPPLNLGHALDGIRAKTAEGPQQVPKGVVLQGTYSAESISRAQDTALKGLAALKQEFPAMA